MSRIYISSTFADLVEHRAAVYKILRRVGHDVIAMEDYVAADERPADKCLADVASCDLYIGLLAWRYGYVPDRDNPDRRSVTELEFREAGHKTVPRLMFLAETLDAWPDEFIDERTGQNDSGRRIAEFRDEVGRDFLVGHFRNPDQLAGLVLASVYRQFQPPATSPAFADVKARILEKRKKSLIEEYEAVSQDVDEALGSDVVLRLKRRLERLGTEIESVEAEIAANRRR